MYLAFKLKTLDVKTKQGKQQMLILAGLHVLSRDFSDEFPCSGICVITISMQSSYFKNFLLALGSLRVKTFHNVSRFP